MCEKRPSKAAHALQFNVAQLLKQATGTRRVYDVEAVLAPVDAEITVVAPFRGRVQLLRAGTGVWVTGRLETVVALSCTRCLSECRMPVNFEIKEEFCPSIDIVTGVQLPEEPDQDQDPATLIDERHILDLAEVIRQDLWLSLPSAPICRPDCKGLCPQCGQNRSEDSCHCEAEVADVRWAALQSKYAHLAE